LEVIGVGAVFESKLSWGLYPPHGWWKINLDATLRTESSLQPSVETIQEEFIMLGKC